MTCLQPSLRSDLALLLKKSYKSPDKTEHEFFSHTRPLLLDSDNNEHFVPSRKQAVWLSV